MFYHNTTELKIHNTRNLMEEGPLWGHPKYSEKNRIEKPKKKRDLHNFFKGPQIIYRSITPQGPLPT